MRQDINKGEIPRSEPEFNPYLQAASGFKPAALLLTLYQQHAGKL